MYVFQFSPTGNRTSLVVKPVILTMVVVVVVVVDRWRWVNKGTWRMG